MRRQGGELRAGRAAAGEEALQGEGDQGGQRVVGHHTGDITRHEADCGLAVSHRLTLVGAMMRSKIVMSLSPFCVMSRHVSELCFCLTFLPFLLSIKCSN